MPTCVRTGALAGLEGVEITVEVDLSRGLPGFHLVGLPGAEVRESRQRVLAALRNSGLKIPPGRITVNLAPAGLPKSGASYDLAIALGVLAAGGARGGSALRRRQRRTVFVGELSLFGEIRPVRGVLPIVAAAAATGADTAVVPAGQVDEARLAAGLEVRGAESLAEVSAWLRGEGPLASPRGPAAVLPGPDREAAAREVAALHGQHLVRKAALVAAAGRHNLLLVGPPGSGKTRLARLLGRLQPPLDASTGLEVTCVQSAAGLLETPGLVTTRPFRAPHHTVTRAGLVGGGDPPRPGEVTLAHRGILFLDEVSEFHAGVLDALREPLEDGRVGIARGRSRRVYPADFQLVAAANPCRCGFLGSAGDRCRCTPSERRRHRARLSGPLLDRIDLCVEMGAWVGGLPAPLTGGRTPAVDAPGERWRDGISAGRLAAVVRRLEGGAEPLPDAGARSRLQELSERLGMSLRGVGRCLRVARTLAALDGAGAVRSRHLEEAAELRIEAALSVLDGPGQQ